MTRKRISLHESVILPLQQARWGAVREKLSEAENAIQQMDKANNRIEFEYYWNIVVDALELAWVRFYDEGKKLSSKFEPWVGKRAVRDRKKDKLLQYLSQARHQSQHARVSLEWTEPGVVIGAEGFNGHVRGVSLFPDGSYEIDSIQAPGFPEATVSYCPGRAKLPVIENRKYSQKYMPPKSHLGQDIGDNRPVGIAKLGFTYYETLLAEAVQKFVL